MSKDLDDLLPVVNFKARHGIAALVDKGIPHAVTSTLRTADEQAALYAQHRFSLAEVNRLRARAKMRPISDAENAYTVTRADGVKFKSVHQSGKALDIVPTENGIPKWPPANDPRWKQISDVMKAAGFSWGGDWAGFVDPPHYEITANDLEAEMRRSEDIA